MSANHLTIDDLESGDVRSVIWALNGAVQSDVGRPGDVHVGIPKINGSKIDPLFLPQTWLPQRLTDQIPRAQLLAASEFRQAVNRELIVLITPEYAKKLLARDGADEEKTRLLDLKKTIKEATAARSVTQANTEIVSTSDLDDARHVGDEADRPAKNALDPSFELFANNLVAKSDIEAMNIIRGRGKATRLEVKHLIHILHDKPKTLAMLNARITSK